MLSKEINDRLFVPNFYNYVKISEKISLKDRKVYFGSLSEISVHGQFAPLLLGNGKAEHSGECCWSKTA
jgi:hypothetical protein